MKKNTKTAKAKPSALLGAMQSHDARTENGAVSHSTTGSRVVDLFGKGGSMRANPDAEAVALFAQAYNEDKTLALKVLFYLADVREGQGERKFFRTCYAWLAKNDSKVATKLLSYIPEYTRYDNVLETLEGTPLEKDALAFIAKQLKADFIAMSKQDTAPTLCAKWAPSEQASSAVTKRLAFKLRKHMRMAPKAYRKMLSVLREKINVVERLMCSGEWKGINYEHVPSKASTIYRKAFGKHDPAGYTKFIGQVEKGEKKINASVLYPYDLTHIASHSADRTVEAQWKALPDYLKDNPHTGLVVADVSGSMDSTVPGSKVRAVDVAVSLAIYFAERNIGAFRNNFLIFSRDTKLLTLPGGSLHANVKAVEGQREVADTNLQSVFDLILGKAVKFKIPQKEMPEVLYIISDGQFNPASFSKTNFEVMAARFQAAGYKLPRIVSWNVNARADMPVKADESGFTLVSGCSPTVFKTAIGAKNETPYDAMLATVNVPRYEVITA